MRLTCCLLILISNACPAWAWIRLNGIFTDNMVLQTPGPGLPPARIFGLAYTSEQVVIEGSTGLPRTLDHCHAGEKRAAGTVGELERRSPHPD